MVGCGDISTHNIAAIAESGNAVVTCAVDVHERLARDIAARCGCAWTMRLAEALLRDDVDAVCLCTPHRMHAPMTVAAARAGRHVICEKPIATTVSDARRMVGACKAAGVTLSVAYCMRSNASSVQARQLLGRGVIGRVIGVQARGLFRKPDSYWTGGYSGRAKTDWRLSRRMSGGGVLLINLSHDLDLIHHLTGLRPVRVAAEMDTFATHAEVEDFISATIRYDGGVIGGVVAGSCVYGNGHPDESTVRLIGAEGQIVFRGHDRLEVFTTRKAAGLRRNAWTSLTPAAGLSGRTRFFRDTARAILAGRPVPIPGEDAIPALELCLAAYRAAETGRPWRAKV
jgi:predicted dehydrogenase